MSPMDAILAGDVGMNAIYLAFIFAIAVAITVVAFIFVFWSTKHPEEGDTHALAKYEQHWVVIIVIIFVLFSVSAINFLPYPYAHGSVHPNMTIDVTGQQFAWTLCTAPIWGNDTSNNSNCSSVGGMHVPSGDTVLLNVTSIDVNHDLGVYR